MWGDGPVCWQDALARLTRRVADLEAVVLSHREQRSYGTGRAGVLITRDHGAIHAQHIVVHHTTLLDAADGIEAMTDGNVAFVQAQAAHTVLDALGVEA